MIPMNDFKLQVATLRKELDDSIARVLESGHFILGPEVQAFESEFARFVGADHAIGVGNGMEAIELGLLAAGIGAGDEVITTPNSAFATALAIVRVGAIPVFVDIDDRNYALDPNQAKQAITPRTRAIMPVHIYGQAAELDALLAIADENKLVFIGDAAQAQGTKFRGRDVGTFRDLTTYSFYPTKNLGAFGDAGMVVTASSEIAAKVRALRDYGQDRRYHHIIIGTNSRLDEMQAAVLRTKLHHLSAQNERRRVIASQYIAGLEGLPLVLPRAREEHAHIYHQFVIRTPRRDALADHLKTNQIQSLVHYPILMPDQPAMKNIRYSSGALTVARKCANEFLSLPIYPEMTTAQAEAVISSVRAFFKQGAA